MKINFGFFLSKLFGMLDRPSLRNCNISSRSKIGAGVHCINTTMGKYSYMGKKNVVVNTTIGSFCSIASYCSIGGGNHPSNMLSTSPVFYKGRNVFRKHFAEFEFDSSKPVSIGNDVWIGEKVFIKDGIRVGDGAIIGAGAIVTKDVPPYAIVAGVPARIIRYRFNEDIISKLLQIKWWDWSNEKLKQNIDSLMNPQSLIDMCNKK